MSTQGERVLAAVGELRGVAAADLICVTCTTVLGVRAAAISLILDGCNMGTLGASGPAARSFDEMSFTAGEGPSLDAVAIRAPVDGADLTDPRDTRWPLYRPMMLAHHIRAVTAVPVIVAGAPVGALTLFLSNPDQVPTGESRAAALLAADVAGLSLLDVLHGQLPTNDTDPDGAAWIELGLVIRPEIAQATGMLMAQLGIAAAPALACLRAHAYATSTSPTDVARAIIAHQLRLEHP